MIQITGLCKSYAKQDIFKDVSLNINKKERIGLIGRNGHGKTTLFRLIMGAENFDTGTIAIPKNYIVEYLDQHIQFTEKTVLKEGCLGLKADQEYDFWRVEEILSGLGFSQADMSRHPSEFSGGFQIRLNLSKSLVANPDLLLLDEPTNYLDVLSIRWLIKFLKSWKNELILITHDRSFMDKVTTHTMAIHRKKIKKITGGTEKLYNQILQEEEIYEKTRINDEKKRKDTELFITRFRAKARLAGMVQSRIKALEKKGQLEKLKKISSLEFSFNCAPFTTKLMMRVENLSFSYNESQPHLIDKFNISISKNDKIGVIGKNGKGKSTLLRLLVGELTPATGQIKGHPTLNTGYFGQTNKINLNPQKNVIEEIMMADSNCTYQKARNISGSLMFEGDMALKKIKVLSGGEKSRVLLGKTIVAPCHLLMLDEPTNHLDMESCDSLISAIDSFNGAVLFVTHNEMYLHTLANRLIIFDRGKISLYEGTYQDFLDDVGWENDDSEKKALKNKTPQQTTDKKVLRKIRAEILQEKSTTLKPLESKGKTIESSIEKLEEELSKNTKLLLQASEKGDGVNITNLSKKNHEKKIMLDNFYKELDELTRSYEKKSKEFEKKLGNIF